MADTLEGYPFGYDSDPLASDLWPHGTHALTVRVEGGRILSARCTSCDQTWPREGTEAAKIRTPPPDTRDPQEVARERLKALRRAAVAWAMAQPGPQSGGAADARVVLEGTARRYAEAEQVAASDRGEPHPMNGTCPEPRPTTGEPCGSPLHAFDDRRRPFKVVGAPIVGTYCPRLSCPAYDVGRPFPPDGHAPAGWS